MIITDANNLHRLMTCTGSRLLVDQSSTSAGRKSSTAQEGEAAHYMAKAVWNNEFQIEELADRKAPNGFFMTEDMVDYVAGYMNQIDHRNASFNGVDVDVSFSGSNWSVKAKADHISMMNDSVLYVDAFHYGYGIVEPENNWALIAAAIGFCINQSKQPLTVILAVYQPRPFHPDGPSREWAIDYETLVKFYKEINDTLSNPSDRLKTGTQCTYCPAIDRCPAARKAELNAIDVSERAYEENLPAQSLSYELDLIARAKAILTEREKALQELAMHRLRHGEIIENYSLEKGFGNARWNEGITPEFVKMITGMDLAVSKLVSPSQAIKRGVSETVVKSLSARAETGLKLARISANKKAERIFNKRK